MEKPKSETPEILSGCAPALVFLLWRVKYHAAVLFQSVACGWFEAIQCILLERRLSGHIRKVSFAIYCYR